MVLQRERKLLLPARIQHDVADLAFRWLRAGPPDGLGGDEIDEARRAFRVVRVEHRQDPPLAAARERDVDLPRGTGELVLIQDGPDRHPLRDEIALVDPTPRQALDLREEMLLREALLVAEIRIEKVLGEVEADLRRPQ